MWSSETSAQGTVYALCAFLLWGFMPMYFKLIADIPAPETLTHRIIWSSVLTLMLCAFTVGLGPLKQTFADRQTLQWLIVSALLVGGNWLLFIWAVNNDHLVEASLGYYINPLFNMLLGYLFLGERLTLHQRIAAAMAVFAVGLEIFSLGKLPWVALCLALSFGVYGLIRKRVNTDSLTGLSVETTLLMPLAAIYLIWSTSPSSDLLNNDWNLNLLLMAAGPATAAPLLFFVAAGKRLTLSMLGFLQYIAPSIMFLLAIFLYKEPVSSSKWITFILIWSALALVTWDGLRHYPRNRSRNTKV